jgi:phosphatidylglycerol---prolipoprotein diacylglyceryl transferase
MSVAILPSPSRAVWHLGPVPVRAYAVCVVLGTVVALAVTARRYRQAGGQDGVILAVATLAVPAGLIGARGYGLLTGPATYLGPGRGWGAVLQIWDGGIGIPGALVGGGLGGWLACRRAGVTFGPVAGAAAPAIALGMAIGRWGNWFSQDLYGRPATWALATAITPVHRVQGYENFATFQPVFLYESAWDVVTGLVVIYAARRFLLTGDRAFALLVAVYSAGACGIQSLRIDGSPMLAGVRLNDVVFALAALTAASYLYLTRRERGPDQLECGDPPGRGRSEPPQEQPAVS